MKRMIALTAVVLIAAAVAQAAPAVYAEITYPTVTTWRLWLTQVDDSNINVPVGNGIAGFAIDVMGGVTTGTKMTPAQTNLINDEMAIVGSIGFPNGPGSATVTVDANTNIGVAQAFGGQDTTVAAVLVYGFGVSAGSFPTPDGWTGSYSWLAPGAPGSASPGVLVFGGKRNVGTDVSIVWGERAQANVFTQVGSVTTLTVPVIPEPATIGLLVLGGLAALRRRR